jgi:hypothetical protein
MRLGTDDRAGRDIAVLDVEHHPTELGFQVVAMKAGLVTVVVEMLEERQP